MNMKVFELINFNRELLKKSEFNAHMNYNAGYTDMMLYKHRNGPRTNSAA